MMLIWDLLELTTLPPYAYAPLTYFKLGLFKQGPQELYLVVQRQNKGCKAAMC